MTDGYPWTNSQRLKSLVTVIMRLSPQADSSIDYSSNLPASQWSTLNVCTRADDKAPFSEKSSRSADVLIATFDPLFPLTHARPMAGRFY
jgi:hypothetical protein